MVNSRVFTAVTALLLLSNLASAQDGPGIATSTGIAVYTLSPVCSCCSYLRLRLTYLTNSMGS